MTASARRRGADLEDAIFDAALAELADRGMDGLTFELIAARAGAGKTSLYRRWPDRQQLVLAALARHEDLAEDSEHPSGTRLRATGDLRDELITFLTDLGEGLATPVGQVLVPLMLERERRPQMWQRIVALLIEPRQRLVADALERAVARGELDPSAVTPARVGAGAALILASYLTTGHVDRKDVVRIVDDVVLPSLRS